MPGHRPRPNCKDLKFGWLPRQGNLQAQAAPIVSLRALTHRRAPKRTSHIAGLQTSPRFTPSPTPTRAEGNFATRPPRLLPTPTRAEEQLAVTPG